MSSHLAGILDGVLVGAVAFGLGGWQLWSLAREKKRDEAEKAARSAESARHPPGEQVTDDL